MIIGCTKEKANENFYISIGKYDHTAIKKDSLVFTYTDSLYIGQVSNINIWKNKILISDFNKSLFIFDNRLKLIKRIGREGQGPGEFTYAPTPIVDSDTLILLNTEQKKYCIYDEKYNLISENKLPPEFSYLPYSPLYSDEKYIFFCAMPSIFRKSKPFSKEKSLYVLDRKFNKKLNFYEWEDFYKEEKYFAYSIDHLNVLLAKADQGFFATQAGNVNFAFFSSKPSIIKKFGLKPRYFKDPPIESDPLKNQRSVEAAVEFSVNSTLRHKIIYDKLNKYLVLGYSNLDKDFFKKRSLLLGNHYLQIFDNNYDCIFDDEVPGQLAFIMNGLIYILTDQTDRYIKFYGYEISKK